jgi:hypothetical protein
MEIKLGSKVRDIVTGYEGIATGRIEYINGCIQYGISAACKDNVLTGAEYFDFQRLEVIGEPLVMPSREGGADKPPMNRRGLV